MLNTEHTEFCPPNVVMSSLWFLQRTAIILVGNIHLFPFLMEAQGVLREVRTEYVTSTFSEAVSKSAK